MNLKNLKKFRKMQYFFKMRKNLPYAKFQLFGVDQFVTTFTSIL